MLQTSTVIIHETKKLRIASIGKGEPIIILHGYPENLQLFSEIANLLAEENEVIAFDWPGMGYSDQWPGGAAPMNMAKHLLQIMNELNIETAHIIGQDMGGQPALVFASMFPQRVLSVTVMNSLLFSDIKTSWEIILLRKFKINQLLLRHFPQLVFWRAMHTFFYTSSTLASDTHKDLWLSFKHVKVRKFIVRMCAGYEAQLKKLPAMYKKINCPLLILWANNDKHFPVAQAQKLQDELPHAKLYIVEKAGHWMVIEKPKEVVFALKEFYASLRN